jgi:ParB family transcriptional regulator, chromosome partitioning protein
MESEAEVVGASTGPPGRRLQNLPLTGPVAAFASAQGRSGNSLAPAALADLISSIATSGLLQPVLVEELPAGNGNVSYRLVLGERRLRAMTWGAMNLPGNPNFRELPAVVCRGPLTSTQRRRWQLAENIGRKDLRPGELAAALLFERCALLEERLTRAGIGFPAEDPGADPAERFRVLEAVASQPPASAVPSWAEVIAAVGVSLSPRRVREVVAAFRALPRQMAEDLDEHDISLVARQQVARQAGSAEAAEEIWEAVKAQGRPDLLAAAAAERAAEPGLSAAQAASRALTVAAAASDARKLRRAACPQGQMIDPAVAESAMAGLRNLATLLRAGGCLDDYTAGSLRLLADEISSLLPGEP